MRYVMICLLLWVLQTCFACWGGKKLPKNDTTVEDAEPEPEPGTLGGWPIPGGVPSFETWMAEYKQMLEAMQKEAGEFGMDRPADAGPYWPKEWGGIGPGLYGVPPPPWAYVPKNVGKPAFCYDPPTKGECQESLQRWGYNPYSDVCVEYTYSGCLGSQNNFKTKERCEQACIGASQGGCDPESHITHDDLRAH